MGAGVSAVVYELIWTNDARWGWLFGPSVSHSLVAMKRAVGLKRQHSSTGLTYCVLFSLFGAWELQKKGRREGNVFLGSIGTTFIYFELTFEKGPHEAFTDFPLQMLLRSTLLFKFFIFASASKLSLRNETGQLNIQFVQIGIWLAAIFLKH